MKITRTVTPDGVSHFKLSVQNPKATQIKSATFFAGQKKLHEWSGPPYALDIPSAKLKGVDFVRASVVDETNYEASDLLFLSGERFSEEIEVNLVELPVMVTDHAGLPVTDLKEPDFSIFENGKPQKITSFNYASNLPIAAGVLLDHSGSMKPRMEQSKSAALEFFKRIMKGGDRAFVTGFAFDATSSAPFVTDVSSLEAQVRAIPDASGGTSLYDAIVTGLYRFRTLQGRKALIILTDGEDTTSRTSYEEMLTYARSARVPLYFIGVGLGMFEISGTSKMKALAAETGGIAYFIHDIKQLGETYAQLEKDLRSQYLIAYNAQSHDEGSGLPEGGGEGEPPRYDGSDDPRVHPLMSRRVGRCGAPLRARLRAGAASARSRRQARRRRSSRCAGDSAAFLGGVVRPMPAGAAEVRCLCFRASPSRRGGVAGSRFCCRRSLSPGPRHRSGDAPRRPRPLRRHASRTRDPDHDRVQRRRQRHRSLRPVGGLERSGGCAESVAVIDDETETEGQVV